MTTRRGPDVARGPDVVHHFSRGKAFQRLVRNTSINYNHQIWGVQI